MADLDQISAEIGALRADNQTAKEDRERLWRRQEETLAAVNKANAGIEKLCTAWKVERRMAAKIAAVTGGGVGAGIAAAFKWVSGTQ